MLRQTGFGAENVSCLRRIALNLLKQEKTAKHDIKIKQHKASWDEKYPQKILGIMRVALQIWGFSACWGFLACIYGQKMV